MQKERKSKYKKKRSKAIMDFIDSYRETKGYAPTVKEISKAIGIRSSSLAAYYVQQLVDEGYLSKEKNVARSLKTIRSYEDGNEDKLVFCEYKDTEVACIPVLAEMKNGLFVNTITDTLDLSPLHLSIPVDSLQDIKSGKNYKAAFVTDNTFLDDLILPGDYIVFYEADNVDTDGTYIICDEESNLSRLLKVDESAKNLLNSSTRIIGKATLLFRIV